MPVVDFGKARSRLSCAIGLSVALTTSSLAQAAELSLYSESNGGDVVIVSGMSNPTIGADGIVDSLTGVPSGYIPTFSLDFGRSNVTTDGTYTFEVAFVVYEEDTANLRLEFSIPNVTMSFVNGEMSLSFPAGSATVYGRSNDGAITANATIGNAMFSNPQGQILRLNVENQLAALTGTSAALFGEVADVIKSDGVTDFVYKVYLKQTSGPTALPVGVGDAETDSANFTEFGCASNSNASADFVLNTGLAVTFTGGYALQGLLGFGASSLNTAPSAYTDICTPTITVSGGGESGTVSTTSTAVTIATETLSTADLSNPSTSTIALVNDAMKGAAAVGNSVATALQQGVATVADGLATVGTLNSALSISGRLNEEGDTAQNVNDLVNTINSAGNVINSLQSAGVPATEAQVATLRAAVTELANNLANNVADNLSSRNAQQIANALSTVLSATAAVGGTLPAELRQSVQAVADNLVDSSASEILERFTADGTSLAAEVDSRPLVQNAVFQNRVSLVSTPATTISLQESNNSLPSFSSILDAGSISLLSSPSVQAFALSSSDPITDVIANAMGPGFDVAIDEESILTEISADGAFVATQFLEASIVPAIAPEGIGLLADGSVMIVDGELGFRAAPTVRDPALFAAELASQFNVEVQLNQENGSMLLQTEDATASVTFAFEGLASSADLAAGPVSLVGPAEGLSPADADYKFTVAFADGVEQSMLPFVAEPDFLESLAAFDVYAFIDRSSGLVDMGDGVFLKPDYLVSPLTSDQVNQLLAGADEFGILYSSLGDVNGDGAADFSILSDAGVQILYGVP